MSFAYWVLIVFIAYFAVLIGISVLRARHMRDMSDYVLGGRKMGPPHIGPERRFLSHH